MKAAFIFAGQGSQQVGMGPRKVLAGLNLRINKSALAKSIGSLN